MSMVYLKLTLIVLVFVVILLLIYHSQSLLRQYKSEAIDGLEKTKILPSCVITEKDIYHLPHPVQKYLRYVGAIGKEKINNFKVNIDGSMKTDKARDWSNVKVQQYSFVNNIKRLFFLKLNMSGIPVIGLHLYKGTAATMVIKLGGLFTVADGKGKEMNQAETVTFFNDMCLLAPATLIGERIKWEPIDSLSTKAYFTNQGITISAILYFNEKGQLINFVSDDRFFSPTGETFENVRWSTPVSNYKNINGFNLPTYGKGVWNFSEGDFCYAKFNIREIKYNVKAFQ